MSLFLHEKIHPYFYFYSVDRLSGLNRIKQKKYCDENGNVICKENLFEFNDLFVDYNSKSQGMVEGKLFKHGLIYTNLYVEYRKRPPIGETGVKILSKEKYDKFICVDGFNQHCIFNNIIYNGAIYVDENENLICAEGIPLGKVISTNERKVINTDDNNEGLKVGKREYTITQIKNNKSNKIKRELDELFLVVRVKYVDDNGKEKFVTKSRVTIDSIKRTIVKDKITIDYYDIDNYLVATEEFFLDDTISYSSIEKNDKNYINHNTLSYIAHKGNEIREVWFEDFGEQKSEIDEPETKGGE